MVVRRQQKEWNPLNTINSMRPPTLRELQVLSGRARGKSYSAIATELGLSPFTVGSHLKHVRERLEARTTTHAVAIAIRRGLL